MMTYKKWITWHNLSSAFFLPLALIFIITGALYMMDVHGETRSEPIPFNLTADMLTDLPGLTANLRSSLPETYLYLLDNPAQASRNGVIWGRPSSPYLLISPDRETGILTLTINRPSLFQTLVLAHKGKTGGIFIAFSILFAVCLIFSYLSGLVLALKRNPRSTWITLILGLVVTGVILWLSV